MRNILILLVLSSLVSSTMLGQGGIHVLTDSMYEDNGRLYMPSMDNWEYLLVDKNKNVSAEPLKNEWSPLDSNLVKSFRFDEDGLFQAKFRINIVLDSTFIGIPLFLNQLNLGATEIYINGNKEFGFGKYDSLNDDFRPYIRGSSEAKPLRLEINKPIKLEVNFVDKLSLFADMDDINIMGIRSFLIFEKADKVLSDNKNRKGTIGFFSIVITLLATLSFFFWALFFLNRSHKNLLTIALTVTCLGGIPFTNMLRSFSSEFLISGRIISFLTTLFIMGTIVLLPVLMAQIFKNKLPKWLVYYILFGIVMGSISIIWGSNTFLILGIISFVICLWYIITSWKTLKGSKWIVVIGLVLTLFDMLLFLYIAAFRNGILWDDKPVPGYILYLMLILSFTILPISLLLYVGKWLKETITKEQENSVQLIKINNEKKEILENQNLLLEQQVTDRTIDLKNSLENLKSTQAQLIQSEKMASLGELTAGIAHEIQNPLNFVNNFSEVNSELIEDLKTAVASNDQEEIKALLADLGSNEARVRHHGKRADSIVKGMLLHSRTSKGEKVPTDINALCDEFLRLSYHGLRAKDRTFNADFETDFDPSIPKIDVVPQDIGRVLLNLFNNAFQACAEKPLTELEEGVDSMESLSTSKVNKIRRKALSGVVKVKTKNLGDKIEITVSDNGPGIPDIIKDKIFQPFFTTKPTGQGTGLGLSLAYDIVQAHGGELNVKSKEGKGTDFIINLLY